VAAVSVLIDGQPATHLYRWCRISSGRVRPGHSDDYAALAEAIVRRFSAPCAPCAPDAASFNSAEGAEEEANTGGGDCVQDVDAKSRQVQGKRGSASRRLDEEAEEAAKLEAELPDVVLIDGGRGQLSAVMAALQRSNAGLLTRFSVVALSKQREELFVPAAPQPLLMAGGMCGPAMLVRGHATHNMSRAWCVTPAHAQ
jgi:excinuclease ABC subunit C